MITTIGLSGRVRKERRFSVPKGQYQQEKTHQRWNQRRSLKVVSSTEDEECERLRERIKMKKEL